MTAAASRLREFSEPRRTRGIAAVEFVVSMPFVFLLLFGTAEIGRAFIHYATLTYAIRDCARFVSEHSIDGTTGVVVLTGTVITQAKNVAVYGDINGTGVPKLPNYSTGQVQVTDAGGDNIQVNATYPYQPMLGAALPGFWFGTGSVPLGFTMQVVVTMRAIS